MNSKTLLCCLVLSFGCVVIPSSSRAQTGTDINAQFTDTKTIVAKIRKDAVLMQSYTQNSSLSWDTHMVALARMKTDVNNLQQSIKGLQSNKSTASPAAKDAIDRIAGYANDLATNMNAAIDRLSKTKSRPNVPPYTDYLKANAQIANDLADEINATIDYGQTKGKLDSLGQQVDSAK